MLTRYLLGAMLIALALTGAVALYHYGRAESALRTIAQMQAQAAEARNQAALERLRRMERAGEEAAAHSATRAAIARTLTETRDALQYALRTPISCPAGQSLPVGDVVVPAAVLDGVRRAAAAAQPRPD